MQIGFISIICNNCTICLPLVKEPVLSRAEGGIKGDIIFSMLLILPFLPDNFPNMVIPLLTVTITRVLVEKLQFTKKDIEISEGLKYQSNWGILWTSIICFVLFLIAAFVFILIIEILGVSVTA